MTDRYSVEVTVARIGGTEDPMERRWGPWIVPLGPGQIIEQIPGRTRPGQSIRVEFDGQQYASMGPDWHAYRVRLLDMNSQPIGGSAGRPALVYTLPCDVPHHVSFQSPEYGVFSVGLRRPEMPAPVPVAPGECTGPHAHGAYCRESCSMCTSPPRPCLHPLNADGTPREAGR